MMLVAIAGPATNLVLALVFTLMLHLVGRMLPDILQHSIAMAALINIVLMVFNLLPIPPLDGSRIVARFLKGRALWNYSKIEPFGMYIVFGLLFLGVFSSILTPVLRISFRLLGISPYLH
jgi:Zn-dependent protease